MPTLEANNTFLTRSKAFKKLTKWAFSVCDVDGTGQVGKSELYSGILLVSLQFAKYTGSAACYPPSRQVIDKLFEASDDDNSGFIDEEEFTQIMVICFAQITSRIVVYYGIIILLVPRLASIFVDSFFQLDTLFNLGISGSIKEYPLMEKVFTMGKVAEQGVALALFFLVVPLFFNWIDRSSGNAATSFVVRSSLSANTEASPSTGGKTD